MITNSCSIVRLFCKSTVIKSGFKLKYCIGLWKKRKVCIKDLSECAVTIGTNILKQEQRGRGRKQYCCTDVVQFDPNLCINPITTFVSSLSQSTFTPSFLMYYMYNLDVVLYFTTWTMTLASHGWLYWSHQIEILFILCRLLYE